MHSKPIVIVPKAKVLALRVVRLYKWLCDNKHETVMSKQVLRSGTSIGANVAEAQYAQSRADFITKMNIALKEASETFYWLELLMDAGYMENNDASKSLIADSEELLRLLVATVKTSRK